MVAWMKKIRTLPVIPMGDASPIDAPKSKTSMHRSLTARMLPPMNWPREREAFDAWLLASSLA
jgi:hypothetical protein